MSELSLEQKVQKLLDIEAIKNLQFSYGIAVDQGWNNKVLEWKTLVDRFFTEDASWESPATGKVARGREEIIELFKGLGGAMKMVLHSMTNPVIEVNGDIAKGQWLLLNPNVLQNSDKTNIGFGSYEIEYVRTPVGWRIRKLAVHFAGQV